MSGYVNYPELEEPQETAPSPTAPALDKLFVCPVCSQQISDNAFLLLECGHRFHVRCTKPLLESPLFEKPESRLWCLSCTIQTVSALGEELDNPVDHELVSTRLNQTLARRTRRNVRAQLETQRPTAALENRLLGRRNFTTLILGAISRSAPALPVAETMTQRLIDANRSLDSIFEGDKALNLADLWVAGVRTHDELNALGFDCTTHMTRANRARLPIFLLCDAYNMNWHNSGLAHQPPQVISELHLRAPELFKLGVTVQNLFEAGWRASHIEALRLSPSHLVKYADFGAVHLTALGFDDDIWRRNKQWRADLRSNDWLAERLNLPADVTKKVR